MKNIILLFLSVIALISCRKAADPAVDSATQFVGTYKDPILNTTAIVSKVDNNTISISYTGFDAFRARITGSNSLGQSSATYLKIDLQTISTVTNTTIRGVPVYDKAPYNAVITDHGYGIVESGKTKLYFRAETQLAGGTAIPLYYVGEKEVPK